MKFNSIKFEISILHTAILGAVLLIFSIVLYLFSNSFFQQFDQELLSKAQAVERAIRSNLRALPNSPTALELAVRKTMSMRSEGFFPTKLRKISEDWMKNSQVMNLTKDYVNFFKINSNEMISSPRMKKDLINLFMEGNRLPNSSEGSFRTIVYNKKSIRVITYRLSTPSLNKYFIQIGQEQDPFMEQLRSWFYSFLIMIPLVLVVASFVGRRQAARILEPVHEITQLANKITSQDLSARIKVKYFDTEMESLIGSFNNMIERLEKSFKHIEEFSHHAAHELKTPLTIIKGEADLLLRKERTKNEYQQALRIILEESERVLKTIEDLLLLAKLDYQPQVFNFEIFDFTDFFSEICEQSRMLALEKGIGIKMRRLENDSLPLMIRADRLHLRRLFLNIIDNAIKFTAPGGRINMEIALDDGKVITTIKDSGIGIHSENLNKIFDKFFKEHRNKPGNGFGLSICKTIAEIHKGEILVESKLGLGSTFKVVLPVEDS